MRSANHESLYYPCSNVLTVELPFSGHAGDLLRAAGDGGSVVLQGFGSEVHRQDGPLRAPWSQRRLVLVSSLVSTWACRTCPNTGSHFVWLTKVTKIGSRNSDTSLLDKFLLLLWFPHHVRDNSSDVSDERTAFIFRVTDFGPHGRWTFLYNH